jgi:predicted aminopeptidase
MVGIASVIASAVWALTNPKWYLIVLAALGVGCLYWAGYKTWRDERIKAELYRSEGDEIYADVILDWIRQNLHGKGFLTEPLLSERLNLPHDKISRGVSVLERLEVLEKSPTGWTYTPRLNHLSSGYRRMVKKP